MPSFDRRDFLKLSGLAAAAAGINAPLATPLAVAHTASDLGPLTNGLSRR